DHRVEVVRRRTAYLLAKAQDREHILEGYLTALDHLDNVITIIRASANRADARENLVAYFGGKKIEINTTGRAPKLDPEKPFTADRQAAVTVSHSGYLKRTPISTYRMQRRGGTGRTGMKTRDEDFVEQLFVASTHAYILIFTSAGRVYWLKVYEIPDVGPAGKGKAIASLISLQPGEQVRAIMNVRDLEEEGKFVFFATRKGTVKKTPLKDFSNVMSRGIIAIGIDKDDELVAARVTDGNRIVFLAS